MERSKLGIPATVIAAACIFTGLLAGYLPMILITGCVLLIDDAAWLKKVCLKALAIYVLVDLAIFAFNFFPTIVGWVQNILGIAGVSFNTDIFSRVIRIFTGSLDMFRDVLFIILGCMALAHKTIRIGFIDKLFVNKKVCPSCGGVIGVNTKFCPHCGNKTE